jgi:hypothetical protein
MLLSLPCKDSKDHRVPGDPWNEEGIDGSGYSPIFLPQLWQKVSASFNGAPQLAQVAAATAEEDGGTAEETATGGAVETGPIAEGGGT